VGVPCSHGRPKLNLTELIYVSSEQSDTVFETQFYPVANGVESHHNDKVHFFFFSVFLLARLHIV